MWVFFIFAVCDFVFISGKLIKPTAKSNSRQIAHRGFCQIFMSCSCIIARFTRATKTKKWFITGHLWWLVVFGV